MPGDNLSVAAPASSAGGCPRRVPGAQRSAEPVAIINNDWAPTLAFAVSLGRRGIPLHFYGPGAGRWSRYCRRRSACPPVTNADKFLPWLRARVRAGEISRLAPTTDLLAYYCAVLREEFPADVRRAITPLDEIERCLIKTRFSDACVAIGQGVPLQAAPEDLDAALAHAEAIGYPLMLKPKSHLVVGTSERGQVVRNQHELRRYFQRYPVAPGQMELAERYPELRWPLLQRYVPSARLGVYSVSGIKDAERGVITSILTCKRGQWPPDIGVSTVQSIHQDRDIQSVGLSTVDKLLSRGIFELELLTDGAELLAIDLNPRAFGFMALDMAAGNDLPWLWWQTTMSAVDRQATQPTPTALECRFVVPYYFGKAIFHMLGPDSRQQRGNAARSKWVSMLGDRTDPVPMLLANLRLLRLLPHPGGLVRPYVAAARHARKTAAAIPNIVTP